MKKGIDVSRYQGEIDWSKVQQAGVEFAILRAVSTGTQGLYEDPSFQKNYESCKQIGLPVGAYYYSYARSESAVRRELALLQQVLADKQLDYPVALDLEDASLQSLSRQKLTDLALFALNQLEQKDFYAMLYTYSWFLQACLQASRLSDYDLWLADYRGTQPGRSHGIWQYSSKGSVPGIKGAVDENIAYKNYPQIMQSAGLNGFGRNTAINYWKIQLGWISKGDFEAAEKALKPVISQRKLEAYYSVETAAAENSRKDSVKSEHNEKR